MVFPKRPLRSAQLQTVRWTDLRTATAADTFPGSALFRHSDAHGAGACAAAAVNAGGGLILQLNQAMSIEKRVKRSQRAEVAAEKAGDADRQKYSQDRQQAFPAEKPTDQPPQRGI